MTFCIGRREFITLLFGVATWPLGGVHVRNSKTSMLEM
jgi:hypothetical protein